MPRPYLCSVPGGLEAAGEASGRVSGSGSSMPGREHCRKELFVVEPGILKSKQSGFWEFCGHVRHNRGVIRRLANERG